MNEYERLKEGEIFKSFEDFKSLIDSYGQTKGYVFVTTNAKSIIAHNKHQAEKGFPTLPECLKYR